VIVLTLFSLLQVSNEIRVALTYVSGRPLAPVFAVRLPQGRREGARGSCGNLLASLLIRRASVVADKRANATLQQSLQFFFQFKKLKLIFH